MSETPRTLSIGKPVPDYDFGGHKFGQFLEVKPEVPEKSGWMSDMWRAGTDSVQRTLADASLTAGATGVISNELAIDLMRKFDPKDVYNRREGSATLLESFSDQSSKMGEAFESGNNAEGIARGLWIMGDAIYNSIRNPDDMSVLLAEQAGNMIASYVPTIALGAVGAATPIPGAAAAGVVTGLFSGSTLVEFSASVRQKVLEAGGDPSDDQAILAVLNDPEMMDEIIAGSARRGATIGAAETLGAIVSFGLLKNIKRVTLDGKAIPDGADPSAFAPAVSKMHKGSAISRTAGASGAGMLAGGLGEGLGSYADTGEVDWAEVGPEMALSAPGVFTDSAVLGMGMRSDSRKREALQPAQVARQEVERATSALAELESRIRPETPNERAALNLDIASARERLATAERVAQDFEAQATAAPLSDADVADTIQNAPTIEDAINIAEDVSGRDAGVLDEQARRTAEMQEVDTTKLTDEDLVAEAQVEYLIDGDSLTSNKGYFTSEQAAKDMKAAKLLQFTGQKKAEMETFMPVEVTPGRWALQRQTVQKVRKAEADAVKAQEAVAKAQADFIEGDRVTREGITGENVPFSVTLEEAQFVEEGIRGKSFNDAIKWIADNTQNPVYRAIAKRVSAKVEAMAEMGIPFTLEVVEPGQKTKLEGDTPAANIQRIGDDASSINPDLRRNRTLVKSTNFLGDSGMSFEALLHEAIHSVTLYQLTVGERESKAGLETEAAKFYDNMQDLYGRVKIAIAQDPSLLDGTIYEGRLEYVETNILKDVHELLAYGMTNPDFQAVLQKIKHVGKISAWDKFVIEVRKVMGLDRADDSALSELMQQFAEITAAEADVAGYKTAPQTKRKEKKPKAETKKEAVDTVVDSDSLFDVDDAAVLVEDDAPVSTKKSKGKKTDKAEEPSPLDDVPVSTTPGRKVANEVGDPIPNNWRLAVSQATDPKRKLEILNSKGKTETQPNVVTDIKKRIADIEREFVDELKADSTPAKKPPVEKKAKTESVQELLDDVKQKQRDSLVKRIAALDVEIDEALDQGIDKSEMRMLSGRMKKLEADLAKLDARDNVETKEEVRDTPGVTLPENLQDPRLKRDHYRANIKSLVDGLVIGGDISIIRSDAVPNSGDQKVSHRTPSVNPKWYKDMDSDTKLPVGAARAAVAKALRGEKLGPKQVRFITAMLDVYQGQREGFDTSVGDPLQYAKDTRDDKRQARKDKKDSAAADDFFKDSDPDSLDDLTPTSGGYVNKEMATRALEELKADKYLAPGFREKLDSYKPTQNEKGEWVLRAEKQKEAESLFDDLPDQAAESNPDITPDSGFYKDKPVAMANLLKLKNEAKKAQNSDQVDRLKGYKAFETADGWVLRHSDATDVQRDIKKPQITDAKDIQKNIAQVPDTVLESYTPTTSYTYPEQAKLQQLRDEKSKELLDSQTAAELETARAEWRAKNKNTEPKGAIAVARKAAEDYYYEDLTWEQFRDTVDQVDPIIPLSDIPAIPSLESVVYALDKNKASDKSGVLGVNHPGIDDGTHVKLRLDIPAYTNYGVHVPTIQGKNAPRDTQYARTAVLSNVKMSANPDKAFAIARGFKEKLVGDEVKREVVNKEPFATIDGSWVNMDSGTARALAQEWFGQPGVVQVGYNPRRHGQFYDKSNALPVVSADEVIQIGNMVLARGVKYGDPMSPELMAKSASGEHIRFTRRMVEEGSSIADAGIPIAEATNWSRFIEGFNNKIVDSYYVPRKVQKAIESVKGKLADHLNLDQALTLFPGETRAKMDDFMRTYQQPLVELVRASGLTWNEAAKFLHARHQAEATVVLTARNPTMSAEAKDALSGMTTAEAQAILAKYKGNQKVQNIGKFNDLIAQAQIDESVKAGLMSEGEAASWRQNYKHYVPLNRVDIEGLGGASRGQGFDVRGKNSQLRVGSLREVDHDNMFAHIMQQHISRIVRTEKNTVSKTLWNMAKLNPDSMLWETDVNKFPEEVKHLLKESQLLRRLWQEVLDTNPDIIGEMTMSDFKVELRNLMDQDLLTNRDALESLSGLEVVDVLNALIEADPNTPLNSKHADLFTEALSNLTKGGTISTSTNLNEMNILSHKVNGVNRYIWLNDRNEVGKKVARAMRNMDTTAPHKIVEVIAKFTRFLSAVITTYSPEFILTNPVRDIQTAMYNMTDTQISGFQKDILKNLPGAMRGIRDSLRGDGISEMAGMFEEMRRAGGTVGWVDAHRDAASYMKVLQSDMQGWEVGGHKVPGQSQIKSMQKFMEDYNSMFENAVRLSAYKVAKSNGLTTKQAAQIAKQLTVDFNQKGEWGTIINAFYLFFNASVQGSARMLRASLDKKNTKIRTLMGATIAAAAISDMMNRLLSDDEDEYNQMLERHGARAWVIKDVFGLTDDGYFKIPAPYGFNILLILGQEVSAAAAHAGGMNPTWSPIWSSGNLIQTVLNVGKTRAIMGAVDSFNPVQSGSWAEMIAPTIMDPSARIWVNKDWHGGPLAPDYNPSAPNYTKYYSGAKPSSIAFTKWLYNNTHDKGALTGGVDISPEWVDMYLEFIAGGAGKFMLDSGSMVFGAAKGEMPELKEVPIARRFYTQIGASEQKSMFYDKMFAITNMGTNLSKMKRTWPKEEYQKAYAQVDPVRLRLLPKAKAARRDVDRYKKLIAIAEKKGDKEQVKRLDEKMTKRMVEFSREYNTRLHGSKY